MKRALIVLAALNMAMMAVVGGLMAQDAPPGLAGMLGVTYYDHMENPLLSTRQFTLNSFDGRDILLEIPDEVLAAAGGIFAVQHQPIEIIADSSAPRDGVVRVAAIKPTTAPRWFDVDPVGNINWSVLMCKVNDDSSEPANASKLQTLFNSAVNGLDNYWSTTSHGITSLSANVKNWKTLPRSFAQYKAMAFNTRLNESLKDCAAAHNININNAYNITLIFNKDMFDGYALGGYDYMGFTVQRTTWLSALEGYLHSALFAHEVGHSYGLPHSNNNDHDNDPYDNWWDVMSGSYTGDYDEDYGYFPAPTNSYYYRQIGFLKNSRNITVQPNSQAVVTLDRWGVSNSPNYQIVTIPISGKNIFFTLETRKQSAGGYEGNLIGDGVLVYEINESRSEPAWLMLDNNSDPNSALTPGETYTNNQHKFSVHVASETADGYVVYINNNITTGVAVTPTMVTVAEDGATAVYTVRLLNAPTSNVVITVSGDAQCAVNQTSLIFTPENATTAQAVTVSAINDTVKEGAHTCAITHSASSADTLYNAIAIDSVTGNVIDDDVIMNELLINGGFEIAGMTNAIPDGWTVVMPTGDKRICKPGKSLNGECAFKFSGSQTDAAKLKQQVDLTGLTLSPGDMLNYSAYFNGNNPLVKVRMTLVVKYAGVAAPVKLKMPVFGNVAYTLYSIPTYTLTHPDVEKLVVNFHNKSKGGAVRIDNVSLIHTLDFMRAAETEVIPPPVVDGFRGNN